MSKDLLVAGLDLTTGHEVHVDDEAIEHWHRKGSQGDGTLVCLLCHEGWDRVEPLTIPLVVKGRIGGERRPHFAHPAGLAPLGGHGPESRWHAEAKQRIARWARALPSVTEAVVECWTQDRARRSDVQVMLQSGERLAIELQRQMLTDQAWRERHRDYVRAGIVDVWLWHPGTGVPHVVYAEDRAGWTFDLQSDAVGVMVGLPIDGDGLRWPPAPGDSIRQIVQPLDQLGLCANGIDLPEALMAHLKAPVKDVPNAHARPPRLIQASPSTERDRARTRGPRGRLMLFPGGRRPPRWTRLVVASRGENHQISSVDAEPPYANPPERYICTCGLILASISDHP